MCEIRNKKNLVRREFSEKRSAIGSEIKSGLDADICRRFVSLASYGYSDTLLAYAPTGDEIDITPIIEDALSRGKTVAFPRCCPESFSMSYHAVKSMSELSLGAYGLLEPPQDAPVVELNSGNTICIIPAVVYDKKGFRVGYGKGYYDRYLSAFRGIKVGVVYSDFIIDSVPHGKYDLAADVIVTEKGVKVFA